MIGATIAALLVSALLVASIGADCSYDSESGELELYILAFGLRFQILGGDKKPRFRKPDADKKPDKPEEKVPAKKNKTDWELVRILTREGLDALRRLRRKLAVDLLVLRFTAASPDAARAAMMYGRANAIIGALFPLVDTALRVRERDIETSLDFTVQKPIIYARVTVMLQIWEIFYIFSGLGIKILNYMYRAR